MSELTVKTLDGFVQIEQNLSGQDDVDSVWVHPDQIPLLIEWLQEAAAELKEGS